MQTIRERGPGHGPAQWHYADPRQRRCGPYSADAIARLFQFGHIRADTPVWRGDDADGARPLRKWRDAFEIGIDGGIRVIPPRPPPAAAAAPEVAPPRPAPPEPAGDAGDRPHPPFPGGQARPASAPDSGAAGARRRWLWAAAIVALALGVAAVALRLAA